MIVPENATAAGEESILAGSPAMFFFGTDTYSRITRIPGIAQASPEILVATLSGAACCSDYLQIIAVDPEHDFTLAPWLRSNPGVVLGKDAIIVGSRVEGEIGSPLLFYGHSFLIAGRLEPTGMRGVDKAVFIRMEDAYIMADESGQRAEKPLVLPRGMVSNVLVRLEPGASPSLVANAISRNIMGTRALTPASLAGTVTRHLEGITVLLHGAMLIATLFSLPALLGSSVLLARETKQEITLLGMLGATRVFILRLVLAEAFSASVIGSLAGIAGSAIFLIAFQDAVALALRIPFAIPSVPTLLVDSGSAFLLTILLGGLISLYPTVNLVRSETFRKIGE